MESEIDLEVELKVFMEQTLGAVVIVSSDTRGNWTVKLPDGTEHTVGIPMQND